MNELLQNIQALLTEELAIIPLKADKAPKLPENSKYFAERISEDDEKTIKELFSGVKMFGLKCGKISENIEGIDFDDHDGSHGIKKIFVQFTKNELVNNLIKSGRIVVQETPSGGYHLIYHTEEVTGNTKLAKWKDGKTMIETRGEGGYIAIHPSDGYTLLRNDFFSLGDPLEKEERDALFELAKSFTQKTEKETSKADDFYAIEETDPISVYNATKVAKVKFMLEDQGWVKVKKHSNGKEDWRRPGKSEGVSATWGYRQNSMYVFSSNAEPFKQGCYYTPFQIMIKLRYKGDYSAALNELLLQYASENNELNYIRVGKDYFRIIHKKDRFGVVRKELKTTNRQTLIDDHGKGVLKKITKFDDFDIEPDNLNYKPVLGNCYNLYNEIPYRPKAGDWKWTKVMLEHIFGKEGEEGSQYEVGIMYLQVLYIYPKEKLPILVLASTERETGKTTFVNWLNMILGNNAVIITPQNLKSEFNGSYGTKQLIAIEEMEDKNGMAVEKIKDISTGKFITMNQKHVDHYKVPFYGKVIMLTNKVEKFIKIDKEENRFFVRYVPKPTIKNTKIEEDMVKEIPAFLHYLTTLDAPDLTQSRFVLTQEMINNETLEKIKSESRTDLEKEIEFRIQSIFDKLPSDINKIMFTASDLFDVDPPDHHLSLSKHKYLLTEIRNTCKEMGLEKLDKTVKFVPWSRDFWNDEAIGVDAKTKKAGAPFVAYREGAEVSEEVQEESAEVSEDYLPF